MGNNIRTAQEFIDHWDVALGCRDWNNYRKTLAEALVAYANYVKGEPVRDANGKVV